MTDSLIVKRGLVGVIILGIFLLAFLVLKPILIPLTLGLLFAYAFGPVYKRMCKHIKAKSISAFILIILIIGIIVTPAIYFTPVVITQTFETYVTLQSLDIQSILSRIIGTDLASTLAINIDNLIGSVFSTFLNQFTDLLVNLPSILLQIAVFLFTFFFALRDSDKMKAYLTSLSPFSVKTEEKFMKEFRGITNAIIFGQVLIGIIQGLALGAALFFLGIPKALTLTFVAIIVSMIPVLGSWLVWLPAGVYLLFVGNIFSGMFLLLYGALFVSTIDNLVRPYMLSRRSNLPISLSIIGTIGGLYFFGIMGLIFGPLVLAYALILIEFYRQGKLNELFKK